MVLSMSLGWFWPIFLFSLRDINLTLGLLPPRKHVVWRDSVSVESSGSGLKIIVRGYFASEFSLLRHTDEPQKGRNSCLWLQTRYVLSSFGVLLMSYRVKFHVVRSALQYSACSIICLLSQPLISASPQNDVHTIYRKAFLGSSKSYLVYSMNSNGPGRTWPSHISNIVLARLAERAWCTNFQSSLLNICCLLQRQYTSSSVGSSHRSYAPVRISEHTAPKYGIKPTCYVTLHFRDRRGAALRRHNRSFVSSKAPSDMISFVAA